MLGRLLTDPPSLYALARRNLQRMRAGVHGPPAHGWLDEWAELLEHPDQRLIEAFLGHDEHSIDLRQVSPFVGALTEAERLSAIDRARSHAPR